MSSALLPGGRIYPVSVPYSNSQSTSKTSVTLSLVMPSQSTLTNGTNTASTLEEGTPTPGYVWFVSCPCLPWVSLYFPGSLLLLRLVWVSLTFTLSHYFSCRACSEWAWVLLFVPLLFFHSEFTLYTDSTLHSLALFILGKLDFHSPVSHHCYAYLCVSMDFTSPLFHHCVFCASC